MRRKNKREDKIIDGSPLSHKEKLYLNRAQYAKLAAAILDRAVQDGMIEWLEYSTFAQELKDICDLWSKINVFEMSQSQPSSLKELLNNIKGE